MILNLAFGAALWTSDIKFARMLSREIDAGAVFNYDGMVRV